MTRTYEVDADDLPGLLAALRGVGALAGEPSPKAGGLVVIKVRHESWCGAPGGGRCTCREEYRDPVADRITMRRRAKNKAAKKARKKGRSK
jgi:hypothetical protein